MCKLHKLEFHLLLIPVYFSPQSDVMMSLEWIFTVAWFSTNFDQTYLTFSNGIFVKGLNCTGIKPIKLSTPIKSISVHSDLMRKMAINTTITTTEECAILQCAIIIEVEKKFRRIFWEFSFISVVNLLLDRRATKVPANL